MKTKTWMVEGRCYLPNGIIAPVRSVVEARTRKEAQAGANQAVDYASASLAAHYNLAETPTRVGDAVALYPIFGRVDEFAKNVEEAILSTHALKTPPKNLSERDVDVIDAAWLEFKSVEPKP